VHTPEAENHERRRDHKIAALDSLRSRGAVKFGVEFSRLSLVLGRGLRMRCTQGGPGMFARALRSGHSLKQGINVVVEEMPAPVATEFMLAYEEQNLGIPIEVALKNMMKRMPNMDLKFFATAVAIQKQAGGDLAEILDKIGHIIRERFKIMGQVMALTGEGRMSGVCLQALPIALFITLYYLNPEYVMLLFKRASGKIISLGSG
jgi:tight adherence protein B